MEEELWSMVQRVKNSNSDAETCKSSMCVFSTEETEMLGRGMGVFAKLSSNDKVEEGADGSVIGAMSELSIDELGKCRFVFRCDLLLAFCNAVTVMATDEAGEI